MGEPMDPWSVGEERFCFACARRLVVVPYTTDELRCIWCERPPEACPCPPMWSDVRPDTTRIPSAPPTLPSKPPNPSDTNDPPSVGTVENVSPQSDRVHECRFCDGLFDADELDTHDCPSEPIEADKGEG